jgi:D-alanyl-D-alanine carboxypeptidase
VFAAVAMVAAVLMAGPTLPPYTSDIGPVTPDRLGPSWRAGCPVGADRLRLVHVDYVGFDGAAHRGELVVADAVAQDVVDIFGELYRNRFPIERMDTVERYAADDDRSMAADNTSAFNCRPIEGTSRWSNHAYGRAVDVNTLRNPYIAASSATSPAATTGAVSPPAGAPYADRTRTDPGMIHADDATVRAFKRRGWSWGGDWTSPKDYQHFEKPPV